MSLTQYCGQMLMHRILSLPRFRALFTNSSLS